MEPIAIIGFAFRLPGGAEDVDSLWEMLSTGQNVMREWPKSRANISAFYTDYPRQQNVLRCKGAHFLGNPNPKDEDEDASDPDKEIFAFDAPFFSTTRKEAASIDPQQRILLETTYHALENAGLPLPKISGSKTGVFAGSMTDDYIKTITKDADHAPSTAATSVSLAMLANRLSWYFDLHGPSMTINTACSSSMVALDLACQSLRTKQSNMAIVAGSNLLLTPEPSLHLSNMNFLSPNSLSRSFDHKGDGYGRGEGVVVLIIKRLFDAARDGDMIRAVIRASGSNQDGHTPGITQPSLSAQEDLIRGLYKSAGLGLESTRYVEAHGTGTPIGDATEANCLGKIFTSSSSSTLSSRKTRRQHPQWQNPKKDQDQNRVLYIGSIKSNIGHLEGASGLSSILKAILILERGIIPPNPLFEKWNPGVNPRFRTKLKVPTECTPWPGGLDQLRRISVNSFGFGGSNSHVVLDDAFHALKEFGLLEQGRHNTTCTTSVARLSEDRNLVSSSLHVADDDRTLPRAPDPYIDTEISGHEENTSTTSSSTGIITPTSMSSTSQPVPLNPQNQKAKLLVWSAPDEAGLRRILDKYTKYLQHQLQELPTEEMETFLNKLSYTLSARRTIMTWRSFAILDNTCTPPNLDTILSSCPLIKSSSSSSSSSNPTSTEITFIFTGQGAQYIGMGLELAQQYPIFQQSLDKADAEFKILGGTSWPSIYDVLQQENDGKHSIHHPQFSQPICTALQLALVNLLTRTFKIIPGAVIGHSSGEIAAAYTAGALSFTSACKVAFHRGRLTQQLTTSNPTTESSSMDMGMGMMSVNLSEQQAQRYLDRESALNSNKQDVHIACINSPSNITLSGNNTALLRLEEKLNTEGIFAKRLNTPVAYHSPAMEDIADKYLESLGEILETGEATQDRRTIMISSVTGEKTNPLTLSTGQYWVDNLVSPVRFADALEYLVLAAPRADGLSAGCVANFLEIGPHGALRRPVLETVGPITAGKKIEYLAALSRYEGMTPVRTIMEVVGRLFAAGHCPVETVLAANQPTTEDREVQTCLVDLPKYPFDHSPSQIHKFESRLSREWRLREGDTASSLLGIPTLDSNPLQPSWRKIISIDELPWIAEHVVGGVPYFPAAGSLMMALEAVKRWYRQQGNMTDKQVIKGWEVKEALFLNPIVVREEGTTEVLTHLRPLRKSSRRAEVQIFALVDGYWAECFKATITIRVKAAGEVKETHVNSGSEERIFVESLKRKFEEVRTGCNVPVAKEEFYDWQQRHGLQYGPVFARLDHIAWNGGDGSTAQLTPLSATVKEEQEAFVFTRASGVLVHPAVLDAAFQLCSTSPSEGMSKALQTTCIPTKMRDVWVSASGWRNAGEQENTKDLWVAAISKTKKGGRGIESALGIFADDGTQLCSIEQFEMSPVATARPYNSSAGEDKAKPGNLVTSIVWKPHLPMMTADQLREYCSAQEAQPHPPLDINHQTGSERSSATRLEEALIKVLEQVVPEFRDMERPIDSPHLAKYLEWAESQLSAKRQVCNSKRRDDVASGRNNGQWSEQDAGNNKILGISHELDEIEEQFPKFQYPISVARNIRSILRGELDANQLFLSTISPPSNSGLLGGLKSFLELWVHATPTNPRSILSLSTAPDNIASQVISFLRDMEERTGWVAFSEFVMADPSGLFLEYARASSDQWPQEMLDRVQFKDLDQSLDSKAASDERKYGLVFISINLLNNVNVDSILQQARLALEPNSGHLVIYDTQQPSSFITTFGFGILSDWWDSRCVDQTLRPNVSLSGMGDDDCGLDSVLKKAGLSGATVLRQTSDAFWTAVSSVSPAPSPGTLETVERNSLHSEMSPVFIIGDHDEEGLNLARKLGSSLMGQKEENHAMILNLTHILYKDSRRLLTHPRDTERDVVIFLGDIGGTFLAGLDDLKFRAVREIISRAHKFLWVTGANPTSPPSFGLREGLLRALRAEYGDKRIVSLSLSEAAVSPEDITKYVSQVIFAAFLDGSDEVEYRVGEDGLLHVGRVVGETTLDNDLLAGLEKDVKTVKTEPWLPGPPLKLSIETPGSLDSLRWSEDSDSYNKPLAPTEIEVEAKVWGVSFRDVFIGLGQLPEEVDEMGLDCAGVVSRVGDGCTGDIRPGDRVFVYSIGLMRMWPRVVQECIVKIPDGLSFADACAAMGPTVTAWHSLSTVARLGGRDKILIHSAAGATGQMAVQVAQMLGAEVFATVGNDEKKKLLMDAYGVHEDHILHSRDLSFAKGLKRVTGGHGVDVVLNSLAGDGLQASWECLAPYGRFVEIGKVDIRGNSHLPMAQFANNVSFSAVDLRHIVIARPEILQDILQAVVQLVHQGKLRPPTPVRTYTASKVEDAFRYLQSGKNAGRILIEVDQNETVQKYITPSSKTWRFDPDATYMVAGGFGGIGRLILQWMAERGARHILVPSRTGAASDKAALLVKELANKGVELSAPICDVTDMEELDKLIKGCKRPIRGCINAAMALNDSTFDNMTHAQWQSTVNSKVQTSWNLHRLLPPDMDFFILLSSVSGIIGNPGQANYAAGCAFQDSLAQYRRQQGLKATSIDLGAVREVGVIAEDDVLQSKLATNLRGMRQVSPGELLGVLDMFCDPSNAPPISQIILGLNVDNDGEASDELSYMQQPMFRHLFDSSRRRKGSNENSGNELSSKVLFDQATTKEERLDVVRQALAKKLARALSIKPGDIDTRRPLHAFGVDSLVAVEIRNWFLKEFTADLAIFELMGGRSVEAVCELAVERVKT